MKKLKSLALLIALTSVWGCAHTPSVPERQIGDQQKGYYYEPAGLNEDYVTGKEDLKRDLSVLQATGSHFLRVGFYINRIEPKPGEFRFEFYDSLVELAPQYGVTLIPYVSNSPGADDPKSLSSLSDFMQILAKRYAGKVSSWELWNEPDNENFWSSGSEHFAQMVLQAAQSIRKADENTKIILGGVSHLRSSYLEKLLKYPGLAQAVDIIDVHSFPETHDPQTLEELPRLLQEVAGKIHAANPKLELWLGDFGYSNHRRTSKKISDQVDSIYDYEHTPLFQGAVLWKEHVLAASSEVVSLTAWSRVNDLPPQSDVHRDGNDRYLGLVNLTGEFKPAYLAFQLYNQIFDQPTRLMNDKIKIEAPQGSQAVVEAFEKENGDWIVSAWLRSSLAHEVKDHTGLADDARQETLAVTLPDGDFKDWQTWTLQGHQSLERPSPAELVDYRLDKITLRGGEVFIAELRHPRKHENY